MGQLADIKAPSPMLSQAINTFVKVYGINMDEAIVPADGYTSFDAFFTRQLKPGSRPIAEDASVLTSPADGRIEDCGRIDEGATFQVKGRLYTVAELLGEPEEAVRDFAGGSFGVVYLAPSDYHRVHAPATGRVVRRRHVDGTLYPVNRIGLEAVPRLFAQNERVAVWQEGPLGTTVSVLVGAIGVGRIGLSFETLRTNLGETAGGSLRDWGPDGPSLRKGDELGLFHLGSTVIVLTPADANAQWLGSPGDKVRMGEAMIRVGASRSARAGQPRSSEHSGERE